jgi:hypothetical protein
VAGRSKWTAHALPIATKSPSEIAFLLTAQQRNTNQIPDPEQRKVLQQAFQQELNELGRQAATRSLTAELYSADQLREDDVVLVQPFQRTSSQVGHPRDHRRL